MRKTIKIRKNQDRSFGRFFCQYVAPKALKGERNKKTETRKLNVLAPPDFWININPAGKLVKKPAPRRISVVFSILKKDFGGWIKPIILVPNTPIKKRTVKASSKIKLCRGFPAFRKTRRANSHLSSPKAGCTMKLLTIEKGAQIKPPALRLVGR